MDDCSSSSRCCGGCCGRLLRTRVRSRERMQRVRLDRPASPADGGRVIYASSMVMLDSARRSLRVPRLARWLLCLGITATLAANVAHRLGHGLAAATVAAWPAVALVGSYELLMVIVRSTQTPVSPTACLGAPDGDPLERRLRAHSLRDGCPRCGQSGPGCMSGSHGRSGFVPTWPRSPAPSSTQVRILRLGLWPIRGQVAPLVRPGVLSVQFRTDQP
jgi:hypothetical protein